jgi:hypothetical protein
MNLPQDLFALAQRLADQRSVYPLHVLAAPQELGGSKLSPQLFLGSERLLHRRSDWLTRRIVRRALAFDGPLGASRARAWLRDQVCQVFRDSSDLPALAWVSPVWVRTGNLLERWGVRARDTTLPVLSHARSELWPRRLPLAFPAGGLLNVDLQTLPLYSSTPRPAAVFVVPRLREILARDGRVLRGALEQALGTGDAEDLAALERGDYPANRIFFRRSPCGVEYLDLWTVTLARFTVAPRDSQTGWERRCGFSTPRRSGLAGRPRFTVDDPSADSIQLPHDPTVYFLRTTFRPEDMQIVVPLVTEREFSRFVAEHVGLGEMLWQAVGFPGNVDD